jgi:hypothetical protein
MTTSYRFNGIHMTGQTYEDWTWPHMLRLRRCCGNLILQWSSTMWSSTTCPKEWQSNLVGIRISLCSTRQQTISCMSKLEFSCTIMNHCIDRTRPQVWTCVLFAGFLGEEGLAVRTGLRRINNTSKPGKRERESNPPMGVTMCRATTVST